MIEKQTHDTTIRAKNCKLKFSLESINRLMKNISYIDIIDIHSPFAGLRIGVFMVTWRPLNQKNKAGIFLPALIWPYPYPHLKRSGNEILVRSRILARNLLTR